MHNHSQTYHIPVGTASVRARLERFKSISRNRVAYISFYDFIRMFDEYKCSYHVNCLNGEGRMYLKNMHSIPAYMIDNHIEEIGNSHIMMCISYYDIINYPKLLTVLLDNTDKFKYVLDLPISIINKHSNKTWDWRWISEHNITIQEYDVLNNSNLDTLHLLFNDNVNIEWILKRDDMLDGNNLLCLSERFTVKELKQFLIAYQNRHGHPVIWNGPYYFTNNNRLQYQDLEDLGIDTSQFNIHNQGNLSYYKTIANCSYESIWLDYKDIRELATLGITDIYNGYFNSLCRNENLSILEMSAIKNIDPNFEPYTNLSHPKLRAYYKSLYDQILKELIL